MKKRIKDTQLDSWQKIRRNLTKRQKRIYVSLNVLGPSNWKNLSAFTGLGSNSISPRLHELEEMKLIKDSGVRSSGCVVYESVKKMNIPSSKLDVVYRMKFYSNIEGMLIKYKDINSLKFEVKVLRKLLLKK